MENIPNTKNLENPISWSELRDVVSNLVEELKVLGGTENPSTPKTIFTNNRILEIYHGDWYTSFKLCDLDLIYRSMLLKSGEEEKTKLQNNITKNPEFYKQNILDQFIITLQWVPNKDRINTTAVGDVGFMISKPLEKNYTTKKLQLSTSLVIFQVTNSGFVQIRPKVKDGGAAIQIENPIMMLLQELKLMLKAVGKDDLLDKIV